jgi:hypothetical protein
MAERRARMKDSAYPKDGATHIHRIAAENKAGRPLRKGEVVHHIDGNRHNYKSENLMIFRSQAEHVKFHAQEKRASKK